MLFISTTIIISLKLITVSCYWSMVVFSFALGFSGQ